MKRMHVHVAVDDLQHSIGFYSALFAAQPSVTKADYAKWMLDDPRVNFAISTRGRQPGLDHLGIQAENGEELKEIYARLHKVGGDAGQPMTAHWGVPDPAEAKGNPAEIALAFKDAYRMLNQRIGIFISLPLRSLDQISLQKKLKEIGGMEGATAKVAELS